MITRHIRTLHSFIGRRDLIIIECFFGIQFNLESYRLESLQAQLMNDYTCTCNCGCENSSDDYVCHNCRIGLCKIGMKKNGDNLIVKAKTQVKELFILCYTYSYSSRAFYTVCYFRIGTLSCMTFKRCVHCGREYESLFDKPTCSSKCAMEIIST